MNKWGNLYLMFLVFRDSSLHVICRISTPKNAFFAQMEISLHCSSSKYSLLLSNCYQLFEHHLGMLSPSLFQVLQFSRTNSLANIICLTLTTLYQQRRGNTTMTSNTGNVVPLWNRVDPCPVRVFRRGRGQRPPLTRRTAPPAAHKAHHRRPTSVSGLSRARPTRLAAARSTVSTCCRRKVADYMRKVRSPDRKSFNNNNNIFL